MSPCYETPKINKTSKRISKFHLKLRKFRVELKKNMSKSLITIFFVHWSSIDCKGELSLTEPRYEK